MKINHHRMPLGSSSTARSGNVLLILLVLGASAVGAWQFGLFERFLKAEEEVAIDGAPVRRGDLRISEIVRGNLEATDSVTLKSEIEGRSTIIYLAEEGEMLKAGDLVCELDVSQLEDQLVRQEIEVKNAEAAFTKAKEQYDIQVIQNESDIAQAELALELAELDLAKYVGDAEAGEAGEWDNELASARENVTLRQEDLARARKDLVASTELNSEGFLQDSELEADQLAEKRATIQLEQARRELALKVKYGNRRRLAELSADVGTKRRDVDKTEKQASARLTDFEAARDSAAYKLERERTQMEELQGQVSKSKIYAPEAGLMVYVRERSRWGGGDTIEEGDEVRERQDIATIPREGGMTVKASIHETKLKKVQVGQPCLVTVDAFPNRTFEGRVEFVAIMADSGSWRSNPNQRLYKADISLLDPTNEMRPGMSCSVEILVEDLKDVHYVPRQSVFMDGGEPIAFVVKGGETVRTPVDIGLDNSKWVTVKEGLTEGQTVALAPPADFEPAPVPESDRSVEFPSAGSRSGGRPTGGPAASTARGGGGKGSSGSRPSEGGSRGGRSGARPTSGSGRPTKSKGGAE